MIYLKIPYFFAFLIESLISAMLLTFYQNFSRFWCSRLYRCHLASPIPLVRSQLSSFWSFLYFIYQIQIYFQNYTAILFLSPYTLSRYQSALLLRCDHRLWWYLASCGEFAFWEFFIPVETNEDSFCAYFQRPHGPIRPAHNCPQHFLVPTIQK